MASALDVARYLIRLASPNDEDADLLTHMRLQKLLYYCQGWHLALFGHTLFVGRIEAWTHGPVVKEVYPAFASCRHSCVPPDQGAEPAALTPQQKLFIQSIWSEYKKYSASALREMTHSEPPWLEARGSLKDEERSSAEITPIALRAFFLRELQKKMVEQNAHVPDKVRNSLITEGADGGVKVWGIEAEQLYAEVRQDDVIPSGEVKRRLLEGSLL